MIYWVINMSLEVQLGGECQISMKEAFVKIVNYFYKKASS